LPGLVKFVRVRTNSFAFPNVAGALLGETWSFAQESFVVVVGGVQVGTAAAALPGKAIKPTPRAAAAARTSPTRLLLRMLRLLLVVRDYASGAALSSAPRAVPVPSIELENKEARPV
jgi:hypothetical protein